MNRLLCAIALTFAILSPAHADDVKLGQITISTPWARATPGRATNGAGYLELRNAGMTDRLIGASSTVSARTELHAHISEDGIMKMRKLDAVDLPHGGMVRFQPHGNHIMFIGLKAPLKEGETVHLTLSFENAGDVTIDMPVMPVGHRGAMSHGKKHMKHGDHTKQDDGMKHGEHKTMKGMKAE